MGLIITRINNLGGVGGCGRKDTKRVIARELIIKENWEREEETEFEVIYRNCVSLWQSHQWVSEVLRGGSYIWNHSRSGACGDGEGCGCSLIIIKRQTSLALGILNIL